MPRITDQPPQEVLDDLAYLREKLDEEIPAKMLDRNLLIASWNIRGFGNVTEKWKSGANDSPKRDLHSVLCIAEIISRFDVVALQEARGNLTALKCVMESLGPNWGLSLTDVTKGSAGNDERMAFLFDTRKAQLSGLACELVVPKEKFGEIAADALDKQFARTPYAVSFRAGQEAFILVTLHVTYVSKQLAKKRIPELKAIAEWLAGWAADDNVWHQNIIALGDFNIDRAEDDLYKAFTSTGLHIPQALHDVPRTLSSDPDNPDLSKFYDQIAWFENGGSTPAMSMKYLQAGGFDFSKSALKSRNLNNTQLSWRISDHYPLWVEFSLRD